MIPEIRKHIADKLKSAPGDDPDRKFAEELLDTADIYIARHLKKAPNRLSKRDFNEQLLNAGFTPRVSHGIRLLYQSKAIGSMEDLSRVTDSNILRLPNFGKRALTKIRDRYPLEMPPPDFNSQT